MTKKHKTPLGLSQNGVPFYCEDIQNFTMGEDPGSPHSKLVTIQNFHMEPIVLAVYRDTAMSALSVWQRFCDVQIRAVKRRAWIALGELETNHDEEPTDLLAQVQRLPPR